ncbi:hypothetical protein D3C72_1644640 [compost metagenome]
MKLTCVQPVESATGDEAISLTWPSALLRQRCATRRVRPATDDRTQADVVTESFATIGTSGVAVPSHNCVDIEMVALKDVLILPVVSEPGRVEVPSRAIEAPALFVDQ